MTIRWLNYLHRSQVNVTGAAGTIAYLCRTPGQHLAMACEPTLYQWLEHGILVGTVTLAMNNYHHSFAAGLGTGDKLVKRTHNVEPVTGRVSKRGVQFKA